MGVDTTLVGKEVFVDGESRSDGTVGVDVGLDSIDTTETIGGGSEVLVVGVVNGGVGLAGALALGLDLDDIVAASETGGSNVMSALGHGVIETEFTITEVTTGNNTSRVEPSPRGTNLTTVATL